MTWPKELMLMAIILALSSTTRSQNTLTNATCTASFSWSENSFQQSPCIVTALLESLCVPLGGVQVPALPVNNHYNPPSPSQATTCECSTITYMLISACAACQSREWIAWQDWSVNCPIVELGVFPLQLPSTIVVPSWAYMNISQINGTFNVQAAQSSSCADASLSQTTSFSSSASPTSTLQDSTSLISSPTQAPTQVPTQASAHSSTSTTNVGAIAGGIVGGLAVLVSLALMILWLCIRRSKRAKRLSELQPKTISPELNEGSRNYLNSSMSTVPTPYSYVSDVSHLF
ncbi:hypothetical protein GYMLUDRAFT_61075 [Collybiopsis luxurians FD-317 M1]|uniref:Mid2 domain-containing protein n=1 Tax=Collybiopsis luxurians FD-317 M1 TaxID=944289 RepID=A0A0D0CHE0_9AGAR|nr:hypothetical protein GYMLUDRAFT_61075 [Collybiopsis luxurians FD-317 M1]